MEQIGWISLHRNIIFHWIYHSPKHFQRWIDMLFMASWEERESIFFNRPVKLKRGQFVTSNRLLQKRWRTNAKTVITFLSTLEHDNMIQVQKTKWMTIISIVNYDRYQTQKMDDFPTENPLVLEHKGKREGKHKKNNINNKINNPHTTTRTREEDFFEQLKASEIFLQQACHSLACEQGKFDALLEKFISEMRALEKEHEDFSDCKQHFYKWAQIEISKQQEKNGNESRQGAAAADKYAKRRGTEPATFAEEDYDSSF